MYRDTIVRVLKETATLLELAGENPFRVRAYENAARTFEGLTEEPQDLLEAGTLAELPGIGPGVARSVAEIVHSGRLGLHEELRRKYPIGLLDLYRVDGLGPKRIRLLYRELGVESPADLERACRDGRVENLTGFGAKSQAKILDSVTRLGVYKERHLISDALATAAAVQAHLASCRDISAIEIAGSLRRRRETIGDLDFVASVEKPWRPSVADHFARSPGYERTLSSGETKVQIELAGGFRADLRMVAERELASALHHFTGSKEHNVALRERAKGLGLVLNEYGLFRGKEPLPLSSESQLFEHLGLAWIPPELREGMGEIELAETGRLPLLLESRDLRGTFHVHSNWSDGKASIAVMAEAAAELGWDYLGIADHSRAAAYAGGLAAERVLEQWAEIDAWNESGRSPRLFKGSEVDILADGTLDFDDDLLLGFDYVVASIHSRFRLDREAQTARLIRAVSHPCVTFLGHPTGRLLLAREGYEFDFDRVLDVAGRHGVIVEVNASPHRLDIDWRLLRGWLARGYRTSIHPDAHSPQGLTDVQYGVGICRKAGASRTDVLNTDSAEEVARYFESRRRRARTALGR